MGIYAFGCVIGSGVAINFVTPVIAVITTCSSFYYHKSLLPRNSQAQTNVVHPDRAKVRAGNDEACIRITRYVCMLMYA